MILIYIFQSDVRFGFRLRNSRLPLFYLLMPVIGILDYLILSGARSSSYSIVVVTGIAFWLLCILASHQVKLSVERHDLQVIHKTVTVFYIINAIISLGTLITIIAKTGAINPYLYQGDYQLYFIGTGDYIRGVSFDTSTTNAVLNAFGVIYFLSRREALMSILCMAIVLLTGSNTTNLILCAALITVFIFQSNRDQKSLIVICLFLLVIFMGKISPQNNQYLANTLRSVLSEGSGQANVSKFDIHNRGQDIPSSEEQKEMVAIQYLDSESAIKTKELSFTRNRMDTIDRKHVIPVDNINGPAFQHKSAQTTVEQNMSQFINAHSGHMPISSDAAFHPRLPGKLIAWHQSYAYLSNHPIAALVGTGIGNFSSKLAFKTSGLKIAGSWPLKYRYINQAFLQNHLDVYLYYFSKTDGYHSTINSPASVYDQVITEYGLVGFAVFLIFYAGYFLRKIKYLSFGIPLMMIVSGIFFFDYWFEQFSVVVFFELLMYLNLKERNENNA